VSWGSDFVETIRTSLDFPRRSCSNSSCLIPSGDWIWIVPAALTSINLSGNIPHCNGITGAKDGMAG
jgi:hypothetical protein